MQIITLKSHVGSDGLLKLQLPEELRDHDVTVTIQSNPSEEINAIKRTAGSIPDLERPPQGEYGSISLLQKHQTASNPFK